MSVAEITQDTTSRMQRAVDKVGEDFSGIRTGRANPKLLDRVLVEYYGSPTPLQQLANFSVPEPRILMVNPFDKSAMNAIEKAIRDADLGLNPSSDGVTLRCVFPELTADRRKEYIKMAKQVAEDGRIAVRNIRRSARDGLQRLADDSEIGQDEQERAAKKLEDVTGSFISQIDALLAAKEQELAEV